MIGARDMADIVAALWPERCKALVSVSGYLIGSQAAGKAPLPPKAELQWWYQYYFATDRGRDGYDKYRHDFSKLIWQIASPKWNFEIGAVSMRSAPLPCWTAAGYGIRFSGVGMGVGAGSGVCASMLAAHNSMPRADRQRACRVLLLTCSTPPDRAEPI